MIHILHRYIAKQPHQIENFGFTLAIVFGFWFLIPEQHRPSGMPQLIYFVNDIEVGIVLVVLGLIGTVTSIIDGSFYSVARTASVALVFVWTYIAVTILVGNPGIPTGLTLVVLVMYKLWSIFSEKIPKQNE